MKAIDPRAALFVGFSSLLIGLLSWFGELNVPNGIGPIVVFGAAFGLALILQGAETGERVRGGSGRNSLQPFSRPRN